MNLALPWQRPAPMPRERVRRERAMELAVVVLVMLICAALVGFVAGVYGDSFANRPTLLLALPLMLALGLCFALSRTALLMTILFLRALLDPLLSATRMGSGPGLGGVVNGLILLLVLCLVFDAKRTPFKEVGKLWLPLIAMYLVGIVFAPSHGDAVRTFLAMLTYPATFLVGARLTQRQEDFDRVAFFLVASAALVNLYAWIGVLTNQALFRVYFGGHRLTGGFPHPNVMAFYEVMIVALCLYLMRAPRPAEATRPPRGSRKEAKPHFLEHQPARTRSGLWKGLLVGFVLVTSVGALVLTQTRSAWVAVFVLFLLYGWFVNRKLLPLVVLLPFLAMLIPEVRDRVAELQSGNEMGGWTKLNSYAWRELMWTSAIHFMGPSKFITGYGLNTFVVHSPTFFPLAGGVAFGAHNVYVQFLFELGIGGVLALLWLMGQILRTAWRMTHGPVRQVVLFLAVMFLIVCWSDNMMDYLVFNLYLFYVLGAGWALARAQPAATTSGSQARQRRRRHPPPWSSALQSSR